MSLRCCKSPIKFIITFDSGNEDSIWSVCKTHSKHKLFQNNIKEKKEID